VGFIVAINLFLGPVTWGIAAKALLMAIEAPLLIWFSYSFDTWALSNLFASSHVLVSVTSLIASIHYPVFGWFFLAATAVGLIELMCCKSFLKQSEVASGTTLHCTHQWLWPSSHAMLVQSRKRENESQTKSVQYSDL